MPKAKSKKPAPIFVEVSPEMRRDLMRLVREDARKTGDPAILSRWLRQILAREIEARKPQ